MKTSRTFIINLLVLLFFSSFLESTLVARELKLRLPFLCAARDLPWLQITELESGKVYKTRSPRAHMLDNDGTLCAYRIPEDLLGNVLINLETGVGYSTAWSWYAKLRIDDSKDIVELLPPNSYGSFEVAIPKEFYDAHEKGKLDWYVTVFKLDDVTGLPDPYSNFSASVFPALADRGVLIDVPFIVHGNYLLIVESSDGSQRAYQKKVKIGEGDLSKFESSKTPMAVLKTNAHKKVYWRLSKENTFEGFVAVGFRNPRSSERVYYLDREGKLKEER